MRLAADLNTKRGSRIYKFEKPWIGGVTRTKHCNEINAYTSNNNMYGVIQNTEKYKTRVKQNQ